MKKSILMPRHEDLDKLMDEMEEYVDDVIEKNKKKHGKIVKDTTTTETNKKLNIT